MVYIVFQHCVESLIESCDDSILPTKKYIIYACVSEMCKNTEEKKDKDWLKNFPNTLILNLVWHYWERIASFAHAHYYILKYSVSG